VVVVVGSGLARLLERVGQGREEGEQIDLFSRGMRVFFVRSFLLAAARGREGGATATPNRCRRRGLR